MAAPSAPMRLRILTPSGTAADTGCDSVILTLRDDREGKGGGLVGIQKDHAPALFALGPGELRASLGGRTVLAARTGGGFASVKDNEISVIADSAETAES